MTRKYYKTAEQVRINRAYKSATTVELIDYADSFYRFRTDSGYEFDVFANHINKLEECYVIQVDRRTQMNLVSQGMRKSVIKIVNKTIDKSGKVKDRRNTEKYQNDIEKWNKVVKYNLKAKLMGIGLLHIINDKIVYFFDNTVNARIPILAERTLVTHGQNTLELSTIEIAAKFTTLPKSFAAYSSITSIKLNPELTDISDGAFAYCSRLKEIDIPANVRRIGNNAFAGCQSLESIRFNGLLKYIGRNCFYGCYKLEEVILPNGMEKILENTFGVCTNLKYVFIPKSVKHIDKRNFDGAMRHNNKLVVEAPKHLREQMDHSLNVKYY